MNNSTELWLISITEQTILTSTEQIRDVKGSDSVIQLISVVVILITSVVLMLVGLHITRRYCFCEKRSNALTDFTGNLSGSTWERHSSRYSDTYSVKSIYAQRTGPYGESDAESDLATHLLFPNENEEVASSNILNISDETGSLPDAHLAKCDCFNRRLLFVNCDSGSLELNGKPKDDVNKLNYCIYEGIEHSLRHDDQYANTASDNQTERENIYDIPEIKRASLLLLNSPVGPDGAVSGDDYKSSHNSDETCLKTLVGTNVEKIDYDLLDWNKLFRFLANNLDAGKWMLFFSTLYDNSSYRGNLNVKIKLQHVENDTKHILGGNDTVSMLVEQFKAWKEVTGRNAKYTVISRSLAELNMNDTLETFETYLRTPPLLSRKCIEQTHQISPELDAASETQLIDVRRMPSRDSELLSLPSYRSALNDDAMAIHSNKLQYGKYTKRVCEISYEVGNERLNEIREDPDGVPTISDNDQQTSVKRKQEDSSTQNFGLQCGETKENTETVASSSQSNKAKLSSSHVKQKVRRFGLNRRKVRQKRKARRFKGATKLSKQSFELLMNSFLQSSALCTTILKPDMYKIYLQNTIAKIVKETGKSAKEILRLRCTDWRDAKKLQTQKEVIFSMYSGETLLILHESTFKELRLYMESARQQVVTRLGDHIDKESEDHLFIDYDGSPIMTQEAEAATSREQAQNENSTDESSNITVEDQDSVSDEN